MPDPRAELDDPPYCRRCGHACAHNPRHALVEKDGEFACEDERACAARLCSDCSRRPGSNANNGCEACAEQVEEQNRYACECCGTRVAALHRTSPKGELFRGKCSACLGLARPSGTFEQRLLDALTPVEVPDA